MRVSKGVDSVAESVVAVASVTAVQLTAGISHLFSGQVKAITGSPTS